jgi:uncharacterized protein
MHYLLIYEISEGYLERRAEFREEHLRLAWEAHERGELLLGGAVGDPVESAMMLFQCDTPAAAKAFAQADPYVTNGLVASWRVVPWQTVAGAGATTPLRPGALPQ